MHDRAAVREHAALDQFIGRVEFQCLARLVPEMRGPRGDIGGIDLGGTYQLLSFIRKYVAEFKRPIRDGLAAGIQHRWFADFCDSVEVEADWRAAATREYPVKELQSNNKNGSRKK